MSGYSALEDILRPENTASEWSCACGCVWFRLIEGGEVQCDQCDATQTLRHFDPTDREDGV